MRFGIVVGAMVAAVSAFADMVTSSATYAVMEIDSTLTNTVVAVPWLGCGGGAVKVKDLVKVDNLTSGDVLYYWEGGTNLKSWKLNDSSVWEGVEVSSSSSGTTVSAGSDSDTVARGSAVILHRQNPSVGTFYIYGQVDSSTVTTTIRAGMNLVACPTATDCNLNTYFSSASNGDMAYIVRDNGVREMFIKDSTGWYTTKISDGELVVDRSNCSFGMGQGFWYNAGSGFSVSW